MDSIVYRSMLYDFYSALLTEKQRSFYALYYLEDLSLNEIGEQYDISPQAVSDLLKRTHKILEDYEDKLNLIKKFSDRKAAIEKMQALLTDTKQNRRSAQALEPLNFIEELLDEFIKDGLL